MVQGHVSQGGQSVSALCTHPNMQELHRCTVLCGVTLRGCKDAATSFYSVFSTHCRKSSLKIFDLLAQSLPGYPTALCEALGRTEIFGEGLMQGHYFPWTWWGGRRGCGDGGAQARGVRRTTVRWDKMRWDGMGWDGVSSPFWRQPEGKTVPAALFWCAGVVGAHP